MYILSVLKIEKHDFWGGDLFTSLFVGVLMNGTVFFDMFCETPPLPTNREYHLFHDLFTICFHDR